MYSLSEYMDNELPYLFRFPFIYPFTPIAIESMHFFCCNSLIINDNVTLINQIGRASCRERV
jgi:hypothetical protein